MNDIINQDTLKPGDVVGIKRATKIGWSFFRYPKTVPMTIERITPARTKFIMTNGAEFKRSDPFYQVTAESQNESYIAECAEKINRYLLILDALRRDGKLYKQDDETIVTVYELLERICKEVSE